MNFIDTLKSVDLVLATGEVPLIVGESGIGKTALAKEIAKKNNWSLIIIDGNLLKEGEIGGLPTIDSYITINSNGDKIEKKSTVYAIHNKLRQIDEEISKEKTVLLFIDEINRCEHTVQQELMNLILNREINGYNLQETVKILAAMNPSSKYGSDFDYQVVDMDAAQENRFVWLYIEPDYMQWLDWAIDVGIEQKVIDFISTFPEYLHKINKNDIRATPRSYERISKAYKIYKDKKDSIPRSIFLNIVKGNVGKLIAEEFVSFVHTDYSPLITYEDVFSGDSLNETIIEKIKKETHTRLYLSAKNILKNLEANIKDYNHTSSFYINRLIEFLKIYPVDLMIGLMKDIKNSYTEIYNHAIENEAFVDAYLEAYSSIRG
ncbi:ATP-binding protein [Clostridium cellulovorans]|uniref:ATPase associated with various cellular activities AAA_5 n=1 Tax=Clostridium cellulovorans (strain ATCC 35296 / DSM 3052 / OCM 3 / 743B) TaxID=573061 RepID=D9SNH0_CLOC7|nr:ATP-binding protein [Clostridium cellulovorans]ADL53962.1 ATPase associated with various cellular activities AAA_5 [Clostridium cellulovorans 743B]